MAEGRQETHRAFTLLEMLVSLLVVSGGVVTVLWTMTQGIKNLREQNQNLLARAAVKRQMEYVRTLTFAQVVPGLSFQDINPSPGGDGVGDGLESLPGATGTIAVCDYNPNATPARCDGSVSTNIKQITVTVALNAGRSWRATTLISQ